MRQMISAVGSDRLFQIFFRFVEFILPHFYETERSVGEARIGIERERSLQVGFGVVIFAQAIEQIAEISTTLNVAIDRVNCFYESRNFLYCI